MFGICTGDSGSKSHPNLHVVKYVKNKTPPPIGNKNKLQFHTYVNAELRICIDPMKNV